MSTAALIKQSLSRVQHLSKTFTATTKRLFSFTSTLLQLTAEPVTTSLHLSTRTLGKEDKRRQWTSDLSYRLWRMLWSLGATRVRHPHSVSLTLSSYKTLLLPILWLPDGRRPSCRWTCLSSLVKTSWPRQHKNWHLWKGLGTKHTNILPLKQSTPFSLAERGTFTEEKTACFPPDVEATPRYSFMWRILLACLGCEYKSLAASKVLPEKRRNKTNAVVYIQVRDEKPVWLMFHYILFQCCRHLSNNHTSFLSTWARGI